MKNIVHIISNAVFEDGVANYVWMLSSELHAKGFPQKIIVINKYDSEFVKLFNAIEIHTCIDKWVINNYENRYISYFKNFFLKGLKEKFKLASSFLDEHSDALIFFHGEEPELMRLYFNSNLPSVNVIHGEVFFPIYPFKKNLLNKSRRLFNHSVILDEKYKNIVKSDYTIIRTGINCINFSEVENKVGNELTLGYIGRLSREKNTKLLIELIDMLAKENIKCKLLIAGDGKERSSLQRLILKKNLKDQVEFLGIVKDKNSFYSRINLLLILSRYEGMPLTALEALCAGIPIISSNVGVMNKIVIDNENGFIIDNWNLKRIIEIIKELVNEPARLKLLSRNAKQKSKEFSIENMSVRYVELIKKLINE